MPRTITDPQVEEVVAPRRPASYQWRLREVMAGAALFSASDLEPLLAGLVMIYPRPTQVAMHASLPSGSARTRHIGACASETR